MLAYAQLSVIIICMILKGQYSKNNPDRLNAKNITEACLDVIYDILIEPNLNNISTDDMETLLKAKSALNIVGEKALSFEKLIKGNLSLESKN